MLRAESQWLGTYPRELPNLIHNRLTCFGWTRDRIGSSFSGFDRGWGLLNEIAMGDETCLLRGHTSNVTTCDLDSRGRYGVSGGWDGNLRVWDLERGTLPAGASISIPRLSIANVAKLTPAPSAPMVVTQQWRYR